MILLGHNITNSANIGGLLRLADAFNVEKVVFTGNIGIDTRKVKKVSRNAHQFITWELAQSTMDLIQKFKSDKKSIIALELNSEAIPIKSFKVPNPNNLVLIVGNEKDGIENEILKECDSIIYIPMLGKNYSMNVTSATAIALYELSSV